MQHVEEVVEGFRRLAQLCWVGCFWREGVGGDEDGGVGGVDCEGEKEPVVAWTGIDAVSAACQEPG